MDYMEAVSLARENDERGFGVLYEKTSSQAFLQARMYMKNEDDAADVVQDAYIRAFSKLDMLEEPEKFPAWFKTIVGSTAKNALKKKNPLVFSSLAEEEDTEYEIEDDRADINPELSYTREETRQMVQGMIDGLSDEQRVCIVMFHLEEKSIKEIAEELGCSENTVKSRLKYGRDKIREQGEAMQKKGYTLYGVAPLPLFLYLLRWESVYLENEGSYAAIKERIVRQLTVGRGVQSAEGVSAAAQNAAEQGMQSVKRGFMHTATGKLTAAAIGLCLIGGAAVYEMTQQKPEPEKGAVEETMAVEEDKKVEEEAAPAAVELQDADYETLIAGNLTKEELQFVLAYGPQEIPEQGFQNKDYLNYLNVFCDVSGGGGGMITHYGTDSNWMSQYSLSDVNRLFRAFTDYQLQEADNPLAEYNVRVSGDMVAFIPATVGMTANAVITSTAYTGEVMEIYYTHDYITTDMGMQGIPKKVENKKAVLKQKEDGLYQITEIHTLDTAEGEGQAQEMPEEEQGKASETGFPAGKYSYVAGAGGARCSLNIEESGAAEYVALSSGTGKISRYSYQMTVVPDGTAQGGVTVYLLEPQDGAEPMTLYYNAERGVLQDMENGIVWERVE